MCGGVKALCLESLGMVRDGGGSPGASWGEGRLKAGEGVGNGPGL